MDNTVTLLGLDFGTTTSSAAIASAKLTRNAVTGRMELCSIEPRGPCEQVFTPFIGDRLDEDRLGRYLDQWLGDLGPTAVFGGGAMITGLAAQAANAASFARGIRQRLKDAVVAVAADPRLESWLAFMGNCWELSCANPDRVFVNFDIGGGTTNIAMGRNGEVLATGSLFVGARHVQVEPGSYRITALSSYARSLLDHLKVRKSVGDQLSQAEVQAIVDSYLLLLESVLAGTDLSRSDALASLHVQAPFDSQSIDVDQVVTLSGGVGQLAYRGLHCDTWPRMTAYGDLGIDLAQELVQRPLWRQHLIEWAPTGLGSAILFGLVRHNTQVSGSTIYLSDRCSLPLSDLAILGTISRATPPDEIERLLALAARTTQGACLRIDLPDRKAAAIRAFGLQLRRAIARHSAIEHIPLVLLVRENLGKILGQLVTDWGRSPAKVVVIDEIDASHAQFGCIGRLHQGVLPVSFHGLNVKGSTS